MKPPFPSLTAEWHNDTYPAIAPRRLELSVAGKTVVVSGGGTGIGRGIAEAFIDAGASTVAIIGRRESVLQQAKEELEAKPEHVVVRTYSADVTDSHVLEQVARDFGHWDILISNAAYMPASASVEMADSSDWWTAFEVNVKGCFNLVRAFLPTRRAGAAIISVTAGSIQVSQNWSKHSGYNASKLATLNIMQTLAVEHPDVHIVSMHPGIVRTAILEKGEMFPVHLDTVELPSHFAVWLASDEARFLRGRLVWANWDVNQLLEKKADIGKGLLLTDNILGWPYAP